MLFTKSRRKLTLFSHSFGWNKRIHARSASQAIKRDVAAQASGKDVSELQPVTHKIHHSIRNESQITGGRKVVLDFTWGGERLPGILLLPAGASPVPAALLLHGLHLDKERMSGMAGEALLRRGIASLTLDLPLHGERSGSLNPPSKLSPFDMMRRWRGAQEECAVALRYLAARPDLDNSRLALVGYSLGAFLGLRVAAQEPLIRCMVIAGGGDLPEYTPFISIARAFSDPLKQARHLAGRPLLMIHGRYDKAITPAQAERLFLAAGEPKKFVWWECGHVLPPEALDTAAAWLAERFGLISTPCVFPEGARHFTQ